MSEPELLPCPFCGGIAVLTNVRTSGEQFYIGCYSPGCVNPRTVTYASSEEVTALWNRRALAELEHWKAANENLKAELHKKPERAAVVRAQYEILIRPLTDVARTFGYALGVHGSLARDIDLIAVPWVETAAPAKILVGALRKEAERVTKRTTYWKNDTLEKNPRIKPHGRLCWSIPLAWTGIYLDVAVMPLKGTE